MAMRDIPSSEWRSFFDSFSRVHAGWIVNLETHDRAGTQIDVRERPLRGITLELPLSEGSQGISVMLDGPHQHFARLVPMPTRVVLDQTDDGVDCAVIIHQQFGPETVVRFRSPMRTDMVDGVAAQEERAPKGRTHESVHLHAILAAVDFTTTSSKALHYAATLARLFNARLHVLHVVPDAACETDRTPDALLDASASGGTEEIRHFIGTEASGVALTISCRVGTPVVGILDYARQHGIDLIVMGTHAHGHVSHMEMGSVAELVLREAPCPLLVVRHPEHEFVNITPEIVAAKDAADGAQPCAS